MSTACGSCLGPPSGMDTGEGRSEGFGAWIVAISSSILRFGTDHLSSVQIYHGCSVYNFILMLLLPAFSIAVLTSRGLDHPSLHRPAE